VSREIDAHHGEHSRGSRRGHRGELLLVDFEFHGKSVVPFHCEFFAFSYSFESGTRERS